MKQPAKPRRPRRKRDWSLGVLAVAALAGWGVFSLTQDRSLGSSSLGDAAMEHARELVAFGPRPSGSQAHQQMQQYILEKLEAAGLAVEQDPFTATTPNGPIEMNNLIARSEGRTDRVIVLATHYETKWAPDFRFVGANDGGSGTALLLALAAGLAGRTYNHAVWLVFLDGEEAFREWSDTDSLYGSRHLAAKWKAAGITSRIGAFLLVDMIGDADLGILRDSNSTAWLRDRVWSVARRLGHSRYFLNTTTAISDDHLPFLQAGVPAVDLIDYDYGPGNRYWHTAEDTLDKISPKSLQVVGEVLLGSLDELDRE